MVLEELREKYRKLPWYLQSGTVKTEEQLKIDSGQLKEEKARPKPKPFGISHLKLSMQKYISKMLNPRLEELTAKRNLLGFKERNTIILKPKGEHDNSKH